MSYMLPNKKRSFSPLLTIGANLCTSQVKLVLELMLIKAEVFHASQLKLKLQSPEAGSSLALGTSSLLVEDQ